MRVLFPSTRVLLRAGPYLTPGPTSQRHAPAPVPRPRCAPNNSRIMEHGRGSFVNGTKQKLGNGKSHGEKRRVSAAAGRPVSSPPASHRAHTAHSHSHSHSPLQVHGRRGPCAPAFFPYSRTGPRRGRASRQKCVPAISERVEGASRKEEALLSPC